ncbi:hypothetical protein V5O48_014055 [Marasmius crinis-equi]|uniref:Uncharacterized protein n=1 Tax=Marasmius crinis-equi TaxID=585013 RepID=A0ABR3EYF8_9AGAR
MSPSTFSLVEVPSENNEIALKTQAKQEMDLKSSFLGWLNKGFLRKDGSDAGLVRNLESDSDAWMTVEKEDY